jgi:TAT-translocated FGD2 family F420-dependent dehydrogenase
MDARGATGLHGRRILGYMVAHEQFPVPEVVAIGEAAARAGFDLVATSDHFQPWQANEGHSGAAWVTLGALGARTQRTWMGTAVTCPILRYRPAIVAEAFASLALLYPGRIFLGVGSGEAHNEQAATGQWPGWAERWERLEEAIEIIRSLWTGREVDHRSKHYTVKGRLYDPPTQQIPLLTAANGKKSMRLAGKIGDGLITDPQTWKEYKSEWEAGVKDAGKNAAQTPIMIEHFVVVGDMQKAATAAALWRFLPEAYSIRDPKEIQQRADRGHSNDAVLAGWSVGTDPKVHIEAVQRLFESGATIINIHPAQQDQEKAIDFYRRSVLPELKASLLAN